VKAAIIHDFLYATGGTGVWKRHPAGITRAQPYSRAEADRILRQAMHNRGVVIVRRNIIWAAVRVGGWAGWGSGEAKRPSTAADERFITGRGGRAQPRRPRRWSRDFRPPPPSRAWAAASAARHTGSTSWVAAYFRAYAKSSGPYFAKASSASSAVRSPIGIGLPS
jgi:hypothetical protein